MRVRSIQIFKKNQVLALISSFNSSKKLHFGSNTRSRSIISLEIFTAKFLFGDFTYLYTGTRQCNEPGSKFSSYYFRDLSQQL